MCPGCQMGQTDPVSNRPTRGVGLVEASDDDLMLGFAGGSYEDFEILYARHKDAVYRYFLRVIDPASAADAHQETWTRIVANRRGYRAMGRFRAYLFTVAHNVMMDQFRRPAWETGLDPDPVADGSPEADASGSEVAARLNVLIERLPVLQREALVMRKEAGLTIKEIAAITGVTEEGVKSRLRYAMTKLKAGMRGYV